MSFGFSVGDFISALQLVGAVIAALRESGGAKTQFRELTNELYCLETALLSVKQLEFEEEQYAEYAGLCKAACQCQHTIDDFWKTASGYQKHLLNEATPSQLKSAWFKLQWSLTKKDDLAKFKTDIAAHTQSIMLLLAVIQTQKLNICNKANHTNFTSLRSSFQDAVQQCVEKLGHLSDAVSSSVVQSHQIFQNTIRIVQTNIRIYQMVCSIHAMLTAVPPQVERQQPVYMIDALGKISPFHLEFVRSASAFRAVLRANFEPIPSGTRKMLNGEFVIYDSATGRQVDLDQDWQTCFFPGQRIDMRMVFQRRTRKRDACPVCQTLCARPKTAHSDTECLDCGLIFGRITKVEEIPDLPPAEPGDINVKHYALAMSTRHASTDLELGSVPPLTAFDESEDIKCYRRIRVLRRSRKRVWHNIEPDVLSRSPAAILDGKSDSREAYNSPGNKSQDGDVPGLADLSDILDIQAFSSVLDMDDDDIEREFTTSLILDFFRGARDILDKIKGCWYSEVPDWAKTSMLAHWLKGYCANLGLQEMRDTAFEVQVLSNPWRSDFSKSEDVVKVINAHLEKFEELFEVAKVKLQKFYRIEV